MTVEASKKSITFRFPGVVELLKLWLLSWLSCGFYDDGDGDGGDDGDEGGGHGVHDDV
jgi:hypothetical protein